MSVELKAKLLTSVVFLAVAVGTGSAKADDTAAEIRLLKAKLHQLEQRIDVESRKRKETDAVVRTATAPGGPYVKGPLPVVTACPSNVFCYKGITITPGGYVELAGIYRDHNMASDLSTPWNSIPLRNNRVGRTDETRFTARGSRFSLLVQGNVDPVTHLTGYGEIDFQGAAQTANSNNTNSYNPRLRHAFGVIDRDDFGLHVVAGQTWSLATMFNQGLTVRKEQIPVVIDQGYLPGFTFTRQPQIRIVKDFGPAFAVGVSAENPATTFAGTAPGNVGLQATATGGFSNSNPATAGFSSFNSANTLSLNHVPDFVAKAAWDPKFADRTFHVEGYGIYRDFYDRFGGDNHDVSGGGFGGSVLIPIIPKTLDVQFSGLTGSGIGRYGASSLPDVTYTPTGRLKTIDETQLLAGVILHATPKLDLYAYAGQEEASRNYTPGTVGGTIYGYGNPLLNNAGCNVEGSTVCAGNTRLLRSVTAGLSDIVYSGAYGKLQAGATVFLHPALRLLGRGRGSPCGREYRPDEPALLSVLTDRNSGSAQEAGPSLTAGIAGCELCASPPGHAGRSTSASSGTRPPSACSGCTPPRGTAAPHARRRPPLPCAG